MYPTSPPGTFFVLFGTQFLVQRVHHLLILFAFLGIYFGLDTFCRRWIGSRGTLSGIQHPPRQRGLWYPAGLAPKFPLHVSWCFR